MENETCKLFRSNDPRVYEDAARPTSALRKSDWLPRSSNTQKQIAAGRLPRSSKLASLLNLHHNFGTFFMQLRDWAKNRYRSAK